MNEYSVAFSEVLTILNHMNSKYSAKLPTPLIKYLYENKDSNYLCNIDFSIPLKDNNLDPNTLTLLAMLLINFWCESPEEKQELINLYFENEQNYQKALSEKYDPNLMFDKVIEENSNIEPKTIIDSGVIGENQEPIKEQEPTDMVKNDNLKWYQRLINKIKSIFTKKNHG